MPVKRVIDDPGYGHVEIQVARFKAREPNASLFEIPNGYAARTEADDACGAATPSVVSRY